MPMAADVAIIIPTYNDSERLRLCLNALARQTYPQNAYRVYVVDNNSSEDIRAVVNGYPFAQYLYEQRPGSYIARNTAIASLNNERWVAFTDADCVPAPNWIEAGITALQERTADAIGGAVRVRFADEKKPTIVELYEAILGFPQRDYIEQNQFAVTANLWVKRAVLEHVGYFNGALFSGGDLEWGNRLHAARYRMVFDERVEVAHPARTELSQLTRKIRRTAGGSFRQRLQTRTSGKLFSWPELLRGFIPPVTIFRQFHKSPSPLKLHQKFFVFTLATYLKWYQTIVRLGYKLRLKRAFERL